MALSVTELRVGVYQVDLSEPETTWLKMLAGHLLSDETAIVAAAVNFGLVEMFSRYVMPEALKGPVN